MGYFSRKRRVVIVGFAALGIIGVSGISEAQTVKREQKAVGPRGKSVERSVTVERGPGTARREIEITRPGGTFRREAEVVGPRAAAGMRPGPGYAPAPVPAPRGRSYGYGPGPAVIRRDVIIERDRGSNGLLPFVAGGALGLAVGSALNPPAPQPVYVVPEPVIAAPPVVVVNPPQRYVPVAPAQPPTVVIDPVNTGLTQLQSNSWSVRRDGAIALGRMGDSRAVPALIDRLKNDHDKNVRQASAWALGEIRDPRAVEPLERAAALDRREEVRTVAAKAYHKVLEPPPAPPSETSATASAAPTTRRPSSIPSSPTRGSEIDDAPLGLDDPPPPPVPSAARPPLSVPR
ncbi:MAG: HEAT repeat domain-containing protein [Isosphaeraceae bacterium]|nr:HEAT repeat domain-containing protein [Isosphaeraceae bacterium]